MADHDSHLPVRSEADGDDERVHVKIVGNNEGDSGDGNAADNQVKISDESFLAVETDGVYDNVSVPANTDPANVGLVGMQRNTSPAESHQTVRITAKVGTVPSGDPTEPQTDDQRSLDVSLHDEAGNAYTAKNPLPVVMEESEGEEIHAYFTTAALAKAASTTLNYDVSGGAPTDRFALKQILISASGKIKAEFQEGQGEAIETFVTRAVSFNSTADTQSASFNFAVPHMTVAGADGRSVQVVITNRDQQPQDVYVTFVGIKYA